MMNADPFILIDFFHPKPNLHSAKCIALVSFTEHFEYIFFTF